MINDKLDKTIAKLFENRLKPLIALHINGPIAYFRVIYDNGSIWRYYFDDVGIAKHIDNTYKQDKLQIIKNRSPRHIETRKPTRK